jgi:hypothetical protein
MLKGAGDVNSFADIKAEKVDFEFEKFGGIPEKLIF